MIFHKNSRFCQVDLVFIAEKHPKKKPAAVNLTIHLIDYSLSQGGEAVLAMSSRTWITYYYQNRFHLTPLSYESLEYAAGFASEQCPGNDVILKIF